MQVVGIIFFACLAFAIAILILITCCFYKVNRDKEFIRDPEMCKSDTIHRMQQIAHNKTLKEEKPPSPKVILFLQKKKKYSDSRNNHYQTHSTGDGLGIGHFNDGFSNHGGAWGHHSNDHGYFDSHDTIDCGHDGDGGHGGDCGGGDD